MHRATNSTPQIAKRYESHVPFPARAKASGMVMVGEVVGAMVETDWASVSSGERLCCLRP